MGGGDNDAENSVSGSKTNIVLIGMPGCGKSTVGILLAKAAGLAFIDTDILIQTDTHHTLQQIIDQCGYQELRAVEERVILTIDVDHHVIATGGSAVYSAAAMNHLRQDGWIVLLDVGLDALVARVGDFSQRGIARQQGQSFQDLFAERRSLYRRYADLVIDCNSRSQEDAVRAILAGVGRGPE